MVERAECVTSPHHEHLLLRLHIVAQLHDGGHGAPHVGSKNSRQRVRPWFRHAMENESRRGDEPVAPLLLHARKTGEELVGYVLAQAGLAETVAGDLEDLRLTQGVLPSGMETVDAEAHPFLVVYLAQVVTQRSTSSQLPSGVTMAPEARLSRVVPQSTAFLPPAFMAMLPPMVEASWEVGSTAKARP